MIVVLPAGPCYGVVFKGSSRASALVKEGIHWLITKRVYSLPAST